MSLFDTHLFVDWSARSAPSPLSPSRDSIWVGEIGEGRARAHYLRTRAEAMSFLAARLQREVAQRRRVLVGWDFPLGYPAGFARALRLHGTPWRATMDLLASLVEDGPDNRNNRFQVAARLNALLGRRSGPFWGRPHAWPHSGVRATSPGFPFLGRRAKLARLRRCEARAPGVQEPWKLHGKGSVGGQALLGIPSVHALRYASGLSEVSSLYPFETRFRVPRAKRGHSLVVHAEIWPGLVARSGWLGRSRHGIRDEDEHFALCRWAKASEQSGELARFFGMPAELDQASARACLDEEGWILGVA
jgi:precorrin-8X/cobalt-precorrin-8 methylmutase